MLNIKNISVMNLENAIRGARNPMNSWSRSDSYYDNNHKYILGPNDLDLAKRLCEAGSDHRKFLRQIFISLDITAPLYWWKEFDTYKIATVANSTSTMHKIHSKKFELSDFSHDQMTESTLQVLNKLIEQLESLRAKFNQTKDKKHWYDLIQLLPSRYNQLRTCTLNYETLRNMYAARKNHKLHEWHVFCNHVESLPYFNELILSHKVTSQDT